MVSVVTSVLMRNAGVQPSDPSTTAATKQDLTASTRETGTHTTAEGTHT